MPAPDLRRRRVASMIISGRGGSGKTTMLEVFALVAEAAGMSIAWVCQTWEEDLSVDQLGPRPGTRFCVEGLDELDDATMASFDVVLINGYDSLSPDWSYPDNVIAERLSRRWRNRVIIATEAVGATKGWDFDPEPAGPLFTARDAALPTA